jgi:hypothetical protein
VVVSRLTSQGRTAIEAKRAAWKSRWEQALSGLELDELRAATLVLERLGAMVEDSPSGVPCEEPAQGARAPAVTGRKPL